MVWIKSAKSDVEVHVCAPPGSFGVWLHRAGEGAIWECDQCFQRWVLHYKKRVIHAVTSTIPFVWEKDPEYLPKGRYFRPDVSDVFRHGER